MLLITLVHDDELRVKACPSFILGGEVSLEELACGQNCAKRRLVNILASAVRAPKFKSLFYLLTRDEVYVKRLLLLDHICFFNCDLNHLGLARLHRIYHIRHALANAFLASASGTIWCSGIVCLVILSPHTADAQTGWHLIPHLITNSF